MAFQEITDNEIQSGKPAKNSIFTRLRDNIIDHETRINNIAVSSSGSNPFIFSINGEYACTYPDERIGIVKMVVPSDLTITAVFMLVNKAGNSGATSIDIKRNGISSIFTSQPNVGFSNGNDAVSSGVLNPSSVSFFTNDILQIDLLSAQSFANGLSIVVQYLLN